MVVRIGLGIGLSFMPGAGPSGPASAPVNVTPPAITGVLTQGQTLTATVGGWTGSPTSFAYQWKRSGSNISGATNSTYVAQADDVSAGASALTVTVTATNDIGSTSAASAGVTIAAGAVTPIPSNTKVISFGDSRTFSMSDALGQLMALSDCFQPNLFALEPRLEVLPNENPGGGMIYCGNMGVSGQHLTNYVGSEFSRSGDAAKSYGYCADSSAGFVLLFGDVNYFKPGGTDEASQITLLKTFLNYVTDPTKNPTNLQKVVVIPDETPIGITLAGSSAQGAATTAAAAAMRRYAEEVRKLDYRIPVTGMPNVVVVPVYEDFLDPTSGSLLTNKVGLSNDGTHQSGIASRLIARKVKAEIDAILTAMGASDRVTPMLPTAATASTFVNQNPMLTGTSGTVGGVGTSLAAGSSLPTNWSWTTGGGTVSSQTLTVTTFTDEDGEQGIRIASVFTGASGYSVLLREALTSTYLAGKSITPGTLLRAYGKLKTLTGSVNFAGCGLELQTRSTGGSGGNKTWGNTPLANKGALSGYGGLEAGGDLLLMESPIIDTTHIGAGGGTWATSNGILFGVKLAYLDGNGSFTIEMGRFGIRVVT